MKKEKIALLIDSGTDVPADYLTKDNIFVLPLRIIFNDGEYVDKVDIDAESLFERIEEEVPSTSLPTGEDILNKLNEIRERGFKKVIAITISSALSGTNTAIKNIIAEYASDLDVFVFDSKSISVGSGLFAIAAERAINAGDSFGVITQMLNEKVTKTKVFFTVGTLEYLKKGGRISSFAALMSDVFNIKPIITCDDYGAYTLVAKERGKKRSYDRLISLAKDVRETFTTPYRLAIVHGRSLEDFAVFKAEALAAFPDAQEVISVPVSPALGVHTGPDAMGIAVQPV